MAFFESSVSEINYDEKSKIVVLTWKGYGKLEQMVEASEKSLELVQSKKAQKMIIDCRNQSTIVKEYEEYIATTWQPKSKTLGVKWIAIIRNGTLIKDRILQRIVNTAGNVQVEIVSTMEEALAFLK